LAEICATGKILPKDWARCREGLTIPHNIVAGSPDVAGRHPSTIEKSPRAVNWRAGFTKTLNGRLRDQVVGTVEIVFKICEAIW
jgi:hypothetical protein